MSSISQTAQINITATDLWQYCISMHFPCISQQQVTLPKRASSVWLWLFWPPYRGRQGTGHRILWNPCLILGRHPQKVAGDTALQASPLSFSTVSNAGMVQRQQQGLLLAVFAPPWPVLVHARWQRSRKAEGRFTWAFPPQQHLWQWPCHTAVKNCWGEVAGGCSAGPGPAGCREVYVCVSQALPNLQALKPAHGPRLAWGTLEGQPEISVNCGHPSPPLPTHCHWFYCPSYPIVCGHWCCFSALPS